MEELAKFKGNGGTIIVYEDRVMIKRSSFSALGMVGDKTFPYSTLGSVIYRKPRWYSDGYIQFVSSGNTSNTHDNLQLDIKGVMEVVKDPNMLLISGKAKESEEIYNLMMQKIGDYNARNTGGQNAISDADELEKFATLKEKGVITEDEFEAKKKQILNQ